MKLLKKPRELQVTLDVGAVTALVYRAESSSHDASLILAHGAGAGQRSPFMVAAASALASRGLDVITFNFPYTEQGRRVPDRGPMLASCYVSVIETFKTADTHSLFIGGKSMGGRIATHVAAADPSLPIAGLVLLGYPLHPPGRPDKLRDRHLKDIHRPMLIVQGSRDAFGTPEEFRETLGNLSPVPTLHVVPGGDHSFKVSRTSTVEQEAVYDAINDVIASWILSPDETGNPRTARVARPAGARRSNARRPRGRQ